jgi:phage terminase large subunit-like protein
VPVLSAATGGEFERWIRDGFVDATDGDTIDYEKIYSDIADDVEEFVISRVVYDRWSGEPVRQRLEMDCGFEMIESGTTFAHMTGPMNELVRLLTAGEIAHSGNPVARWMADNLNAKRPRDDPDRVRPVKPDRAGSGVRIDGMPALFFAIDCRQMTGQFRSAYADDNAKVSVI